MTNVTERYYFFTCSVSEDLYGVCPDPSGDPLPTPSGGKWLPVENLAALGQGSVGFDQDVVDRDIDVWGCHWFTSKGPRDINWGPDGPPEHILKRAGAHAS